MCLIDDSYFVNKDFNIISVPLPLFQMEHTLNSKTTTPHPVLDRAFNSWRQHSTIWYNFPCCRAQSAQQWQTVVEGEGKEDSSFSRKQRYTVPRMVVAPDFITFQFQQKETSSRIKMTFT